MTNLDLQTPTQVNYIYPLSPSCSWPTFWSSQIILITEGLIRKVALLEGELVEVRQAQDLAEERVHHLSNSSAEGA
jgi:hypothetical protein